MDLFPYLNKPLKRSSPLHDTGSAECSLSSSLEKCLNFWDEGEAPRKRKREQDSGKSNSAPGTPQRSETDDGYLKKCRSLECTPTKVPVVKIGTPERLEILYPQIAAVNTTPKPKSPQRLRAELKRLTKPARKRLFASRDFIFLFTKACNQSEIIHTIFSYLNDTDLVSVAKVSRLWKRALELDPRAYQRYRRHVRHVTISKENIFEDANFLSVKKGNVESPSSARSPPGSPARERWKKFFKLAQKLSESQRLTKCPLCLNPSVIDVDVAQCRNPNCQYQWCVQCSQALIDAVQCRCVGVASPKSLMDISNSSFCNTPTPNLADMSSGYFSLSETEKSLPGEKQSKTQQCTVLMDCNKNVSEQVRTRQTIQRSSVVRQLYTEKSTCHCNTTVAIPESSSPPRVQLPRVWSRQSRKNLKRL